MGTNQKPLQWWKGQMNFPCPLVDHIDHELNNCTQFLTLQAAERRVGVGDNRMCWTCLQPRTVCPYRRCGFIDRMPAALRCKGCERFTAGKTFSPFNILMCPRSDHNKDKPSPEVVMKELKRWCKSVNPDVSEGTIVYLVNHARHVYSTTVPVKNDLGTANLKPVSLIDTQSGQTQSLDAGEILREPGEHI